MENIEAGTGLGASIIFRCHDGMKLEGNTSTVCQIDGKWRYPLPKCLGEKIVGIIRASYLLFSLVGTCVRLHCVFEIVIRGYIRVL